MSVESSAVALAGEPAPHINSEGVVHRANDTALALPGLSLGEVRAMPRGVLATEPADSGQPAAPRTWWEASGRSAVAAFTTMLRPASEPVRVALPTYPDDTGGLTATVTPASGALIAPSRAVTTGDVLSLWRAAERLLETIDAASPEYESTIAEITELRATYQRLFEARLRDE